MPHLSVGKRGPAPKLGLYRLFGYVLQLLYMGCQWKMLPIERDARGRPEIHHTRIYRALRRWQADGCIDAIFAGSVRRLHDDALLELGVIHGDGTTTAAKKGGDNLGYSRHKHLKGDKVVAFCDRRCNVITVDVGQPRDHRLKQFLALFGVTLISLRFTGVRRPSCDNGERSAPKIILNQISHFLIGLRGVPRSH